MIYENITKQAVSNIRYVETRWCSKIKAATAHFKVFETYNDLIEQLKAAKVTDDQKYWFKEFCKCLSEKPFKFKTLRLLI